jgi:hypothetical protein
MQDTSKRVACASGFGNNHPVLHTAQPPTTAFGVGLWLSFLDFTVLLACR